MPAGRESLDCTISSGEVQFLDRRSPSSKLGPAKEQTGEAGSSFAAKGEPQAQRRSPAGGLVIWSPYFLLFLLVARRKKTPSRGGEAWEGVFGQRARHGETKASLLTFSSQLS